MRVLVTGANGFVGSHLVRHLQEQGDEVRALVRRTSDLGRLDGLSPTLVYGELTDPPSLAAAVDEVEAVYHVAGTLSGRTQADFDRVNARGTEHLVEACRACPTPPRRLVLVSSIAASGPSTPDRPRREDDPPQPISMYGRSKLAGEQALEGLGDAVEAVIVRPPVVYGSGDTETLDLYRSVRLGLAVRISGPPRPVSFIHVHDLARGLRLAGTVPEAAGQTFFLCGPQDGTLHDLQRAIARAMGRRRTLTLPIPVAAMWAAGWASERWGALTGRARAFGLDKVREGEQAAWVMSRARAREVLGFQGAIGLDDGVAEALAGYRELGWL